MYKPLQFRFPEALMMTDALTGKTCLARNKARAAKIRDVSRAGPFLEHSVEALYIKPRALLLLSAHSSFPTGFERSCDKSPQRSTLKDP